MLYWLFGSLRHTYSNARVPNDSSNVRQGTKDRTPLARSTRETNRQGPLTPDCTLGPRGIAIQFKLGNAFELLLDSDAGLTSLTARHRHSIGMRKLSRCKCMQRCAGRDHGGDQQVTFFLGAHGSAQTLRVARFQPGLDQHTALS